MKPHAWEHDRCRRCAMRSTWEGARHACTGVTKYESAESKARKVVQNRAWRERVRQERKRPEPLERPGLGINPMETS